MNVLLIFSLALLVGVLISGFAERSILSTSVLFLIVGFVASIEPVSQLEVTEKDDLVSILAGLALFSVLFTDGMRLGIRDLTSAWRLPGRALLLGMPLTVVLTGLLARLLIDVSWAEAFLLGAVLAPTDPVFASAIVGKEVVPWQLRHLLNVESGLNDGLALPFVLILLAAVHHERAQYGQLFLEVAGGAVIGIVLPFIALRLEESRYFSASTAYKPLNALAIGMLVLALSRSLHCNEYLAAFAAGITVATVAPEARDSFREFGELITEILKLATLLIFGALINPQFLRETTLGGWCFALLALVLVRPIALSVALARSGMHWKEKLAAAWFGPKGFASVVYGVLILRGGHSEASNLFHVVAITVALSIIAHSSTDVIIARVFDES